MKTKFPKLALGTWLIGGTKERDPNNDDAADIAKIKLALDNGVTLIDTAQNYANGRAEELVGKAIEGKERSTYQIIVKQRKEKLSYQDVLAGCHESMRRLGIDYVDYFLCHAPNQQFDMHEFFRAANKLYKDGFIKHVGVSNFGPNMLRLALETSELPIAVNQVCISLEDDDVFTTKTYDFCIEHTIPLQAYRTLSSLAANNNVHAALKTIADKYSITPQQVVLAYINSYQNMHFTLAVSSKQHWGEIKQAMNVTLASNDIEALRTLHYGRKGTERIFLEQ